VQSDRSRIRRRPIGCVADFGWRGGRGVFWPVLRAGFVDWDDEVNIVNNPHLDSDGQHPMDVQRHQYVRRYLPLAGWLCGGRVLFAGSPAAITWATSALHCANASGYMRYPNKFEQ